MRNYIIVKRERNISWGELKTGRKGNKKTRVGGGVLWKQNVKQKTRRSLLFYSVDISTFNENINLKVFL